MDKLARISLHEPLHIGLKEEEEALMPGKGEKKRSRNQDESTPTTLTKEYIEVHAKLRLVSLLGALRKKVQEGKVIVFVSSCASCDEDGFFCEQGAAKRTECDGDKFYCRGATRKERSDALASWTPMFERFGLDGLNVSLPGNESYSYRIELRRASKEGQLTVANDSERGAKFVIITDLDMG